MGLWDSPEEGLSLRFPGFSAVIPAFACGVKPPVVVPFRAGRDPEQAMSLFGYGTTR